MKMQNKIIKINIFGTYLFIQNLTYQKWKVLIFQIK